MPDVTIRQYADAIGIPVDKLLLQLQQAGMSDKSAEDMISDEEKSELLGYLRRQRGQDGGSDPSKITLRRKTVSEIKVPISSPGSRSKPRSKTVNVEFRKRHTYIKRTVLEEQAAAEAAQKREEQARQEQERQQLLEQQQAEQARKAEQERVATEQAAATEAVATVEGIAEEASVAQVADAMQAPQTETPAAPAPGSTPRKELHVASDKSGKRKKKRRSRPVVKRPVQHAFEKPTAPMVREVEIPESITVAELAQRMSVKGTEVVKVMLNLGSMVTINQTIDQDTAAVVVEEMGHTPKPLNENALEEEMTQTGVSGDAITRAPVVTIMGHVDHGKTSLLDYIRRSKVADAEAGGITQHIGAYSVQHEKGNITFLDTPGHEAFTAMRARGAQVTDIVVVVVAADDGVMPQTEEAVKHAQLASAPMIIAVNKIDKAEVDPDKVRQDLSKFEVVPEDWGGDTLFVNVSAKTGEGVDELLDSILLQAEVLELKAVDTGPASGIVIETRLDKGRGPVAAVLIQGGRLEKGDVILTGHEFGRVRGMYDEKGKEVSAAGPATPVEVLGLSGTPNVGDEVRVIADERKARELALFRRGKYRDATLGQQQTSKLETVISQMGTDQGATVNLLIKADVQGSAEALSDALQKLGNEEVAVNIISSAVGGITESDVNLALASKGAVIGFNVRADSAAKRVVDEEGIDLRYYSIIYEVVDDVKAAINGLLSPEIREQIIGVAEVKEVFSSPGFGDIAGCIVSSGVMRRSSPIRVLRDNIVIYEGELESLRRFKDDVNEVKSGTECGIGVKNYDNVQAGDQIEVFERVEVSRTV
ncbi:MAG: translation initiation factor IF-2 [Gammaproteobacteria bacterium]